MDENAWLVCVEIVVSKLTFGYFWAYIFSLLFFSCIIIYYIIPYFYQFSGPVNNLCLITLNLSGDVLFNNKEA